jgi:hypothetical protein
MKPCKKCGESKPLDLFPTNRRASDGRGSWCRSCQNEKAKAWYHANRDKQRASMRRAGLRKYGLTEAHYTTMLERQGGGCAICGTKDCPSGVRLAVDHDHSTGKVRGILCSPCNTAIGKLRDDTSLMQRAIQYLTEAR